MQKSTHVHVKGTSKINSKNSGFDRLNLDLDGITAR